MVSHAYTSWRESLDPDRFVSGAAPSGPVPGSASCSRFSDPLASHIERYLLDRADWVSTEELCRVFALQDDRPLRSIGDTPGLCSEFAISGNQGFKHIAMASQEEWLHFKHRVRKHGIAELVRVRKLDRRRYQVTRHLSRPALTLEKDSNQILLQMS